MNIKPVDHAGGHRTGTLRGITVAEIREVLGFAPNCEDDPSKVVNSWGFTVDGRHCGIWDYKGSQRIGEFSTFGPADVFEKLFGARYFG
jgi:hypothetical protein